MTTEAQRHLFLTSPRYQNERDAVETVFHAINSMGFESEAFVQEALAQHRTLQQGFTRLCLHWLIGLAEEGDEHGFDDRNAASVEVARQIRDLFGGVPPLPFI